METCIPKGTAWSICILEASRDAGSGTDVNISDRGNDAGHGPICALAALPESPSTSNAGGIESFVTALREFSYGDSTTTVGFDMGAPECTPPHPSDRAFMGSCDIDNSLGMLFVEDGEVTHDELQAPITAGEGTLLIRVREYNGSSNDDQVAVDLLNSVEFNAFEAGMTPAWDGEDAWPVASDCLDMQAATPILAALYSDPAAYISERRLAARILRAQIRLPFGFGGVEPRYFDFELRNVMLTCTVAGSASSWQLDDCTLGGEWPETSFLRSLAQTPDPLEPETRVCRNAQSYRLLRNFYCDFATRGVSRICDAISVGIRFRGAPARLADIFELDAPVQSCGEENDPARDTCAASLP